MKKSLVIILIAFFGFSTGVIAQEEYPLELLPGTIKTINSGNDTLWVLTNEQLLQYIDESLRLKKADSLFVIFQAEINTLQRVIAQKNEIIMRMSKEKKSLDARLESCETELNAGSRKKKQKKKK